MSEHEAEPTEPTEPTEPETEEEAEPTEPTEPEPDAEPDAEPTEPGQSANIAANEETYRQLDTKSGNYFKGVAALLKDSDIPLVPCELCADAYPGVRWVEPQNDQARAMLGIIGATASGSPLKNDPDAELCDRCDGYGWTKLPAHVPGNTERVCKKCNGAGWLDRSSESGALVAPAPVAENGSAEPLPGVPTDDPSVVDLRARGFTVIPPMQIQGAEQPQP